MGCTHITEIIPLYVGNDLDDAETERVTNHLLSCDPCRSLESQYRESSAWLKSVSTADVETDPYRYSALVSASASILLTGSDDQRLQSELRSS